MEWHTLHRYMKDHPGEIVLDDNYINDVVVPSMEEYLKERKRLIEAIIGIYKEQINKIDNSGPVYLCKNFEECTTFTRDCKRCYEEVVKKLEKVLEEL